MQNFPKEDEDNLADFYLLSQKAKKVLEMIAYIVNNSTGFCRLPVKNVTCMV